MVEKWAEKLDLLTAGWLEKHWAALTAYCSADLMVG
jgi:hypothetical protein